MSYTHISWKLPTKTSSDKGEVFHTVMLGSPESHEITDFFLREVQKNLHEFECLGRDDERNYKGMSITITQNKNLMKVIGTVELRWEISLLKIGMDRAFKMNCRYFNLKGKHSNVFKL